MSVNSFIYLKTGICIVSLNITENTPTIVNSSNIVGNLGDTEVIPYPSLINEQSSSMILFAFGSILGSMIRSGLQQYIPFPLFIWNSIAGQPITKEDVYLNDTRLKDEIESIKNGLIDNHQWIYRDWDNTIKPIIGFPENKIVSKDLADIYESIVIDLRVKSIEKVTCQIRKGLLSNQQIFDIKQITGGLLAYLCNGKKTLDIPEIVNRVVFENGNKRLRDNIKKILSELDQNQMRKFLMFATAKQRPPNFSIVPDYHISVRFKDSMNVSWCPISHSCFNIIDIPLYPTFEIMRDKLLYAIENCIEMDNF